MGFRFIHAADIHLDSPLIGLSAYDDAPAQALRNATREALKQLVDRAIEEKVAFVVIAGDLYDGKWRDYNTGLFFVGQMGRLNRAGIRAYVLYGNHDAESEMTRSLALPGNVVKFSSRASQVHKLDDYKVALHGQSFAHRETVDNLATQYKPAVPGYFNIGVLHTALEGYTAHPTYAPCTVDELHAKGYDYWALGHVHEYQKWEGASTIVFPGNLQGRHVRETGRKGAVMVIVNDGHALVERLYLDVLRWEVLRVDVSDATTIEDVARQIGKELEGMLGTDSHVPRAVRMVLQGRTRVHGTLFGQSAQLKAEVLGQISNLGSDTLWLERVKLETTPPDLPQVAQGSAEALAELQAIFSEAQHDPELLAQLEAELKPFVNKAVSDMKEDVPLLDLARERNFSQLVKEVAPDLLARLGERTSS